MEVLLIACWVRKMEVVEFMILYVSVCVVVWKEGGGGGGGGVLWRSACCVVRTLYLEQNKIKNLTFRQKIFIF